MMGLLSILKKMKQKEKDVRLLMLYPCANFVVCVCAFCTGLENLYVVRTRLLVKYCIHR